MGFWSTLGKIGGAAGSIAAIPFSGGLSMAALPGILGAGGAALGAIGQSQAQNRDAKLGAQSDLEQLLLQRAQIDAQSDRDYFDQGIRREQEGRASGTDAYRKLLAAQRTLSPGERPNVSPYAAPRRQPTDMERQGADAMTAEVMARLQGGNPIQAPTLRAPLPPSAMDPRLMQPGKLESISGWLAPILGAAGQIKAKPPILTSRNPATSYIAPRVR